MQSYHRTSADPLPSPRLKKPYFCHGLLSGLRRRDSPVTRCPYSPLQDADEQRIPGEPAVPDGEPCFWIGECKIGKRHSSDPEVPARKTLAARLLPYVVRQ